MILPEILRNNVIRFVPTVEISNIYSKQGKVRKLHNLIIVPSLEVAASINKQLDRLGNLKADGRPILGLDSKLLLKITLESHPESLFVPAHIWTPWFGMFGSKSGFDKITDAFEELTQHIHAIETGLSSDPHMNWQVSQLDTMTVISNSDAHSPQKLGREANVINTTLSYKDIIGAIRTNDQRFIGTIEFFPEEGKYHYDGHRACKVVFTPEQTKAHHGMCPVCHKPLTVGVEYRVTELSDRTHGYAPANNKQVEYIVPLTEIIAELNNVQSTSSKKVQDQYRQVYSTLGDEFSILRSLPVTSIDQAGFTELADAIKKMRRREVHIAPGYDGVYGTVKLMPSLPVQK